MPIIVRDKKLKNRIFKMIKKHEDQAIRSYEKGDLKTGNIHEKKADDLYDKNYSRMFRIVKSKKKLRGVM